MEHDWDDDRRDEPINQEPQIAQQDGGSKPEYYGSKEAYGASSSTKSAMAVVALFSGSNISPKFKIAYVFGIPGVTQGDSAATSTPTAERLVIAKTESPPFLAAQKPVRDKKKGAGSTNRHRKRPRTKSPTEPLTAARVSLTFFDKILQPLHAASPRLQRAPTVAASQRLTRGASLICRQVPSVESVSVVSESEPVLPEPTTMP